MPLVGIKEILTEARRGQYGVLSLLGGNLDMVIGQVQAAEEQRAPLILAFNQGVTPQVPMELAMPMLVSVAQRARVPVATILDHGDSLESVVRAIHLGSSSVMFDGSTLPYEENVRQTQEVVRVAHALGVSVEAELGSIAGSAVETGGAAEPEEASDGSTPGSSYHRPGAGTGLCREDRGGCAGHILWQRARYVQGRAQPGSGPGTRGIMPGWTSRW